jgi:nitrate reductase beta subunit
MFGTGVEEAIAAYANPSRELLAVLQLFRVTQTIVFRFALERGPKTGELNIGAQVREIFDDVVVGYDSQDNEAVRVRVHEPVIERPAQVTMNTI